ncbi:MAG: PTS sugar transporter subunit IIA [Spirochaetaceae bacterium]|jgi:PTS system fructose-specific IIC component/PTS system nitrogen regulatory IIA component|nr:PTS sugar transporter subunit IIA [Spirochaetaceae bacterium]
MFLYEVFPPELIKVGLEAEDKEEAFEEMVDHFCQAFKSNAREEILEALRLRESKMSTGIQKGIAIPHGKTNAVDTVHGVLGISKKGVDYDALDGEPVYLLFMMLAPQKDTEQHLRMLKRLAELLDNPQFYTDLITQGDSPGAHGIIKKYEDVLITLD